MAPFQNVSVHFSSLTLEFMLFVPCSNILALFLNFRLLPCDGSSALTRQLIACLSPARGPLAAAARSAF